MPRNISFYLTQTQFVNHTKTVTRRLGWQFLKVGDILNGCEKCQGLRKGEKSNKLGQIRIIDVRREPLGNITQADVVAEGFPEMTTCQFIDFFCQTHSGVDLATEITRIEFEHLASEEIAYFVQSVPESEIWGSAEKEIQAMKRWSTSKTPTSTQIKPERIGQWNE